jgi:hypothetical protein
MSVLLRVLRVCHAEGATCLSYAGATLLSWEPYSTVAAVKSCSPLPSCADFAGVTCSATGRVTAVYALQHEPPPAGLLLPGQLHLLCVVEAHRDTSCCCPPACMLGIRAVAT